MEEAVAPAPGSVQDEAASARGVGKGELLGDRAAHGRPDDVRLLEPEPSMSAAVSSAKSAIVNSVRSRRAADPPVVEGRDPVAVS